MVNPAALSALAKGNLDDFIIASTPGGIEAQEAQGQKDFVASTSFPKKMRPSKESYEKLGFVFGKDIDDIFIEAQLPKGWKKEGSDHSMWSYILDDKGRRRVSVFYKAAFYDRNSHANIDGRYYVTSIYSDSALADDIQDGNCCFALIDGGQAIVKRSPQFKKDDWTSYDKYRDEMEKEIKDRFPDHFNVMAYWD